MSRENDDLKEAIRLKCKNDWSLELSEDQVDLCIIVMERERVSLFHGQIWPNVRNYYEDNVWKRRITWDKTIDGYRAQAHRHGLAGIDAPVFVTDNDGAPVMCSVTVYRNTPGTDRRYAYIGVARFTEFATKQDEYVERKKTGKKVLQRQWRESPFNQLAIAAEKQALRKGFQEMFGTDEIVEVADDPGESVDDPQDVESPQNQDHAPPAVTEAPPSVPVVREAVPLPPTTYDGSKILNIEDRDDGRKVYELESGFKVLIAADGTELKRKELEKPVDPTPPTSEGAHDGPRRVLNPEEEVAAAKGAARPWLKRWCEEKNGGVKISPKQAYQNLLGVVATNMNADDYIALRECLEGELEGKRAG